MGGLFIMSELAEDYKAWREEAREHKEKRRQHRTQALSNAIADLGLECEEITEYQLRISFKTEKGTNRLDYYPTRNRIHILSTGKRFAVSDKDLRNVFIKYLMQ